MPKSPPLSELEIARETLRRLASNKLLPTPENYYKVFQEIAGEPAATPFPADELKKLQASLPRKTTQQIDFARQLEAAISKKDWNAIRTALNDCLAGHEVKDSPWADVVRELFRQLEIPHAEISVLQKKKALEHVLTTSSKADLLLTRIKSLVRSWKSNTEKKSFEFAKLLPATDAAGVAITPRLSKEMPPSVLVQWQGGLSEIQALIVQVLENTITIVLRNNPELVLEANEISAAVKSEQNNENLLKLVDRLRKLCYSAHFIAEEEAEVNAALLRILQLILENINELVHEDQWLTGQVGIMRDLLGQSLNLRRLDEVEQRLKDVIVKQGMLKQQLADANDRLKLMLSTFVEHLTRFSKTTVNYQEKLEECSSKMRNANSVIELTEVLGEVLKETRTVQIDTARSHDELSQMQSRVQEVEQEVARLQNELSTTSQMVRHDALTGALNRKGLDEALQKEVSRQKRHGGDMSIALLDIDNFKQINDGRGHAVGDAALVHLAKVVQETIRPQDTFARFGGEEFVVLLPNTRVEDAVRAMTRVQRELTRRFFMANTDKVLITFSCGVAGMTQAEDPYEALSRADAAMYRAKRSGKNKVIAS